ncbi:MAG: hypothetical protein ABSH51_29905 [Solirubrobacteraceae bacterium]
MTAAPPPPIGSRLAARRDRVTQAVGTPPSGRTRRAAVAALLAAVACAGCGGSSPATLSRRAFIGRADVLCSRAATELGNANPDDPAAYVALFGQITDQLSALAAPAADRAVLAAYVHDLRATDALLTRLYDASKTQDGATLVALKAQLAPLQRKRDVDSAALAAAGPKACGSSAGGG